MVRSTLFTPLGNSQWSLPSADGIWGFYPVSAAPGVSELIPIQAPVERVQDLVVMVTPCWYVLCIGYK